MRVEAWIRRLWPIYWRQVASGGLRRKVLFGDLKGEERRASKWQVFEWSEEFRRTLFEMVKSGPVEVYGTLEFFEGGEVAARIPAFDVDADENDLSDLRPVYEAWELLRRWGVEATVKLSGGGVHLECPPVKGLPPRVVAAVASYLEAKLGGRIKFCRKIYSEGRMFRLAWSWHAGQKCFAIPLKPEWLLEWSINDLRGLASDEESLSYILSTVRVRARVLDGERFLTLLKTLSPTQAELKLLRLAEREERRGRRGEWRAVMAPDLGRVVYHASLEGYGWIRKLVEEKCLPRDGRLNMCWAVLPEAVIHGIITLEEAEQFVRAAAEVDGKDVEEYLRKLRYECERREKSGSTKPPTWLSLLTLKRKVPGRREWSEQTLDDVYKHIRGPVVGALAAKGLVKLEPLNG